MVQWCSVPCLVLSKGLGLPSGACLPGSCSAHSLLSSTIPPKQYRSVLSSTTPCCTMCCSAGTYSKGLFPFYKTSCSSCSPGTAQPRPGQSGCLQCTLRQYQPSRGAQRCLACPPGSTTDKGRTECNKCAPGTMHSLKLGDGNSCFYCNYGYYQPAAGATTCLVCPKRTATFTMGAASRQACQPILTGAPALVMVSHEIACDHMINRKGSSDSLLPPLEHSSHQVTSVA